MTDFLTGIFAVFVGNALTACLIYGLWLTRNVRPGDRVPGDCLLMITLPLALLILFLLI